jgi:hypothetical protein
VGLTACSLRVYRKRPCKLDTYEGRSSLPRYSATRCRIVECTQVVTLSTRHVPAGPYAGVLATRCVVGYEVDSVLSLGELGVPPGNRLEALSKDRKGQHSIRINDQYRICFKWIETGPINVEITDYH